MAEEHTEMLVMSHSIIDDIFEEHPRIAKQLRNEMTPRLTHNLHCLIDVVNLLDVTSIQKSEDLQGIAGATVAKSFSLNAPTVSIEELTPDTQKSLDRFPSSEVADADAEFAETEVEIPLMELSLFHEVDFVRDKLLKV
jgi:hypothetical protein